MEARGNAYSVDPHTHGALKYDEGVGRLGYLLNNMGSTGYPSEKKLIIFSISCHSSQKFIPDELRS